MPKIKSILVSQPQPEGTKSPYFDIAEKHDLKVVFRPFIKVEGYSINEFSKQKINIPDYSAIVFVARTGVDHFFRLAKEGKMKIVPEMKYFCLTESFAYYIQKYIKFRKRKIFSATTGRIADLFAMLEKNSSEKFLIVLPENGNEELEKLLSKSKLNYTKAYMYRTVSNDFGKKSLTTIWLSFFRRSGCSRLSIAFLTLSRVPISISDVWELPPHNRSKRPVSESISRYPTRNFRR